ncbi:MAG: prolipoprotein diacylglyceryl transferase [Halanaerobium sp.]|nr:prolipoprotein diacylglyceryl transferase [Halanaerobium sp.]
MDPVAFSIGPFAVRWYGILIVSGIIIGLLLAMREGRKRCLAPEYFYDFIIVVIPAAIIGARLYYVIFQWGYFSRHPGEILAIWHGGLAIHGAIFAGLVAAIILTRHYQVNFWLVADIIAPSLILGQAIGRWGNFINQEAYGYPTDLPWAMYIDGAYRHPTFLYEFIWDFSGFLLLFWLSRRDVLRQGEVFLLYLIYYSLGRFVIEPFRTDSLMFGSIRVAQLVSVLLIIAGAGLLWYRRKKQPEGGS